MHTQQHENIFRQWESLDREIKSWWDTDLRKAHEEEIRNPAANRIWYSDDEHRKREERPATEQNGTLLFLPHPYISSAGSEDAFPEMYYWDIYFINKGLLHHRRQDLVRNHLLNHLFMIGRFGMVPNGNRTYYITRSQTPLLAPDVRRYYELTRDIDFISSAYPLLRREYAGYWCADHHHTDIGLTTNRDLGDPTLRRELAAEAEVLDFTPIYDGDVSQCVPLQTNCALVAVLDALAYLAKELGRSDDVARWEADAARRRKLIAEYCWDENEKFFFEYNYLRHERLPYKSLAAYWTLWAGVATLFQAEALVGHLKIFEHEHGLAQTDVVYQSPHPEFDWLQFEFPSGWPPMQTMVVEGLQRYGYHDDAKRIARKFLTLMLSQYAVTGRLWEKYNVVDGNIELPRERYGVPPFHGWSSGTVADFGRIVFGND